MANSPDPLDPLFERWRAETPTLSRSVASDVWTRIESAEQDPRPRTFFGRIELAFSRPAFAGAFVAACVLLGLFLAETRLSDAHRQRNADLVASYLQLLDPRLDAATVNIAPASHQP
jgi:hypothetical protein